MCALVEGSCPLKSGYCIDSERFDALVLTDSDSEEATEERSCLLEILVPVDAERNFLFPLLDFLADDREEATEERSC